MAGRTIVHPGPSVRDVLRRWSLEGSVSFGSSLWLDSDIWSRSSSLIGFEELGNSDVFETAVLELRLSQSGELVFANQDLIFCLLIYLEIGVLQKAENSFNQTYSVNPRGSARDKLRKGNEDDEEFDLYD